MHVLPALQVWFCTVKGLKPWLAPDAKNTRTLEQGGHATWQDEAQMLKVRSPADVALSQDLAEEGACPLAALRHLAGSCAGRARLPLAGGSGLCEAVSRHRLPVLPPAMIALPPLVAGHREAAGEAHPHPAGRPLAAR